MLKPLPAIAALLLTTGSLIGTAPVSQAQNRTFQPGPWQPIARIDPKHPVQVQIVNQAGDVLEYSLTTNEAPPRKLLPGNSTRLSQFSLPAYLLISPTQSRLNLRYGVTTSGNTVIVTVTAMPEGEVGNNTLNIQETGGIFVY